jgi:hypothetical protein
MVSATKTPTSSAPGPVAGGLGKLEVVPASELACIEQSCGGTISAMLLYLHVAQPPESCVTTAVHVTSFLSLTSSGSFKFPLPDSTTSVGGETRRTFLEVSSVLSRVLSVTAGTRCQGCQTGLLLRQEGQSDHSSVCDLSQTHHGTVTEVGVHRLWSGLYTSCCADARKLAISQMMSELHYISFL